MKSSSPYVVYSLALSNGRRTYVGSTNNLARRLRQHRGELKGGARYTKAVRAGQRWQCRFVVLGFRRHTEALSFEWHLKKVRCGSRWRDRAAARLEAARLLLAPPAAAVNNSSKKKTTAKHKFDRNGLLLLSSVELDTLSYSSLNVLVTLCAVLKDLDGTFDDADSIACRIELLVSLVPLIYSRLPNWRDKAALEYFFPHLRGNLPAMAKVLFSGERYRECEGYARADNGGYREVQLQYRGKMIGIVKQTGMVDETTFIGDSSDVLFKNNTFRVHV